MIAGGIIWADIKKYSGTAQFSLALFSSIPLGLSLDNFLSGPPLLTLSLFLANLSYQFRFLLKRYFSESNHRWIDPLLFFTACGIYIFRNLSGFSTWSTWIFPALAIIPNAIFLYSDYSFLRVLLPYFRKKEGIREGDPAPLFQLPDQDGTIVKLEDFAGKRNILMVFIRGDWCPSCQIKLRTYQRHSDKFREKNILLLAISPDSAETSRDMVSRLGLEFKVLHDEGQKTAIRYGMQIPSSILGEKFHPGMTIPASILIDRKGIVRYASRSDRIGEYLDPASILPVVESLN